MLRDVQGLHRSGEPGTHAPGDGFPFRRRLRPPVSGYDCSLASSNTTAIREPCLRIATPKPVAANLMAPSEIRDAMRFVLYRERGQSTQRIRKVTSHRVESTGSLCQSSLGGEAVGNALSMRTHFRAVRIGHSAIPSQGFRWPTRGDWGVGQSMVSLGAWVPIPLASGTSLGQVTPPTATRRAGELNQVAIRCRKRWSRAGLPAAGGAWQSGNHPAQPAGK
jgi:hypothetical protein